VVWFFIDSMINVVIFDHEKIRRQQR